MLSDRCFCSHRLYPARRSGVGTDHKAFADRALRAFQGKLLDQRGLIPYQVDPETGQHYEPSRGIGNSYVLIYAPELYPDQARQWYAQ